MRISDTRKKKEGNAMKFKIVADSCCDLDKELKTRTDIELVPLTLTVSGEDIIDDETFDRNAFIEKVSKATEEPKSSCPSPSRYMEAYTGDYDCVFVVTLSANLSGSYNSAEVGRTMYYEEYPEDKKDIYVFDSCSASVGETLLVKKIIELAEDDCTFEEIVEKVLQFRDARATYFVIESLETLRKNGRLTGLSAVVATVLNIKPVMYGTQEGRIAKLDQARGMEKALIKLAEHIAATTNDAEHKTLAISNVNCPERAEWIKKEILNRTAFRDVMLVDTAGVSTMYACDGGIIVSC